MNQFKLQFGDWSNDGHGKSQDFILETNKSVKDVEEAYAKAKEKSGVDLENICSEYEERALESETYDKLKALGWKPNLSEKDLARFENKNSFYSYLNMTESLLVELFIWYVKFGDPTIEVSIGKIPTFSKSFGYGLYE